MGGQVEIHEIRDQKYKVYHILKVGPGKGSERHSRGVWDHFGERRVHGSIKTNKL